MKNVIYQAVSKITEGREANGSYHGNGHHLAQEITEAICAAIESMPRRCNCEQGKKYKLIKKAIFINYILNSDRINYCPSCGGKL